MWQLIIIWGWLRDPYPLLPPIPGVGSVFPPLAGVPTEQAAANACGLPPCLLDISGTESDIAESSMLQTGFLRPVASGRPLERVTGIGLYLVASQGLACSEGGGTAPQVRLESGGFG